MSHLTQLNMDTKITKSSLLNKSLFLTKTKFIKHHSEFKQSELTWVDTKDKDIFYIPGLHKSNYLWNREHNWFKKNLIESTKSQTTILKQFLETRDIAILWNMKDKKYALCFELNEVLSQDTFFRKLKQGENFYLYLRALTLAYCYEKVLTQVQKLGFIKTNHFFYWNTTPNPKGCEIKITIQRSIPFKD